MGDEPPRQASGADSPALDVTLPADPAGEGEPRGRGAAVGRYILGEPLGSGGMGVVYRARDPDLDRELAIKLVLPAIAGRRAQERLLSEARAMAKLRHPNVVPVFDVGITEQGVYVVMPLVPCGTLHDWLTAEPRPWPEVVARFVAAGRGLAAGHAVGIVHRDFKPHNVLVDEHGTVLVADFGLANLPAPPSSGSGGDAVVTSVVGTPAYMAPEQAAGATVDARADQYSFCISLWEGLYGQRPTQPRTATSRPTDSERVAATRPDTATVPPVPPAPHDREPPPAWLQPVIARGFSPDPARRWPSMDALLGEIESRIRQPRDHGRRRIFWLAAAAVVIAGGTAAAFAMRGGARGGRGGGSPVAAASTGDPSAIPALELSRPRQLTDTGGGCAYAPAFLDDDTVGYDLTLTTGEVDVHTRRLSTGEDRRITDAPTWEWRSNRGLTKDEILYIVTDLDQAERGYAAARDLTTGVERKISSSNSSAIAASDGAYYYITSFGRELRMQRGNVDELVVNLTEISTPRSLVVSPDGDQLAITGKVSSGMFMGVCLVDLEPRTVACQDTFELLWATRVDYGASGALYVNERDGIHARDRAGADRLVMAGVHAFGGVAVAPDGKHLAYSECTEHGAVQEIGVEPARFLSEKDHLSEPAVGPGGVVAWIRERRELLVRLPDGSVRNLIGAGQRGDTLSSLAFDSTGSKVAIKRAGSKHGIWVIDVARIDHEQQVTYDDNDFAPVFLLDGSILFYRIVDDDGVVYRVVPGQEPTQVLARPRETVDIDRKTGRVLLRSSDQKHFYWWDPATGKERPGPPTYAPGTQNTRDLTISPDGHWMLYQSGTLGHDLWRTPVDTWKPELVFKVADSSTLDTTAITDDGHPLIIEKIWTGEVFTVEATRGTL